jgi:hypothetical protein
MATAVTIFLRSPILPSSRNSLKARRTLSCLIHELPPSAPTASSATDTEIIVVSKIDQPSARAIAWLQWSVPVNKIVHNTRTHSIGMKQQ